MSNLIGETPRSEGQRHKYLALPQKSFKQLENNLNNMFDIDDIKAFIFVFLIIIIAIFCIVSFYYFFDKNIQCPIYAKSVNLEYKYNFWGGGCFVNYQGQWIPSLNLRAGKLD